MGFVNSRTIAGGLLAVLATAILVYFGTGLHPWWPLLWFAPLPVLLFATRSSWSSAAVCGFLGWSLGALNLQHYFRAVLGAPPVTLAVIICIPSLVFAVGVLLFRGLVKRGAPWSAVLALPSLYTSFEYLVSLSSPHGTAGSLAYSQLNFLPFLQLASLTGPSGMTFLLLLFSSGLAVALSLRRDAQRRALKIVAVSTGLLVLVLAFGFIRLSRSASGPMAKVGLIASDEPQYRDVVHEGEATERLLRDYASHAETLASNGAQVIVLPEKLGVIVESNKETADAIMQSVADKTNAMLIVGVVDVSPPVSYNQARIYAPGTAVRTYDKHHMLPPFESQFKPGTALTLVRQPSALWGVTICKDMDFTPLSRTYGQSGAALLLVPAWDFKLDRWSHGHMAVMRAVEDGFSIARAARQGYLTATDNRGRILAEVQSDSSQFATLLVDVPAAHDTTLYLMWGDWFAWLSMGILGLTCLRLFSSRALAH